MGLSSFSKHLYTYLFVFKTINTVKLASFGNFKYLGTCPENVTY